jgi:2,3-dihydroxybiphenyl 1,2-dioxygenase
MNGDWCNGGANLNSSRAGGFGRYRLSQYKTSIAEQDQPMRVESLSYVRARTKDLGDWASYGPGLLGLQRIDKSRSTIAFRMDDRKQRIIVNADGGEGIDVFGWEVADAAALEALAARLDAANMKVARGTRALADERMVKDLIVLNDPLGNRLEIVHGAEVASEPFVPGRPISGFRTGPLGLGHVVFNVESVEQIDGVMPFYRELLGFRLTDYYSHPFEARFLHVNQRHHSLAFIKTGKTAVHHIMMEVFSFDDMGQGYDIALGSDQVATSLGRHTSDFITSFYSFTPSGFMVEYGWGARSIDPDTWQAFERREGPSMWGHDRKWLSAEDQAAARKLRLANAEQGMRRPVQVMEGNYQVMSGVCPYWDSVTRHSKKSGSSR